MDPTIKPSLTSCQGRVDTLQYVTTFGMAVSGCASHLCVTTLFILCSITSKNSIDSNFEEPMKAREFDRPQIL